jgi:predicted nucleic acid-binding protein
VLYFDTSYLVRLYLEDEGFDLIRSLAETTAIACSFHGEIETIAAFHRAYREKRLNHAKYSYLLDQFQDDNKDGAFNWLPVGREVIPKLEKVYRNASSTFFLRAADALHLICARENGFTEIYSHDARMLAAASAFGLKAKNIIK